MFINLEEMKIKMEEELFLFFKEKLENNKYFYDDIDKIRNIFDLKFQGINFNDYAKDIIKKIENYDIQINEKSYKLKINRFSIRGEFSILKLDNLVKNKKERQYLKEYILYYILKSINDNNVEIQKNNFFFLYLKEYKKNSKIIEYIKEKYIKSTSIKYYQEYKAKQEYKKNKLIDILYINRDYKDKLEVIFDSSERNILDYFNKILSSIEGNSNDKNKKYFYRGQSNSEWMPSASILREKKYLENEHLMFYKIISKIPKAFEKDKYTYNKIATMQHFGYPTRLLDITENPLIALYFACEGNKNKDGEIFIYQTLENEVLNFEDKRLRCLEKIPTMELNKINEMCNNCKKENCKILKNSYIVQGVAQNERISNQSGNFIFMGISEDKKYFENQQQKPIKHIIIDKGLKEGIIQILETLNVNGGTVYPDLLNLAKYLKE
ncbi:FRG domain-containing protein, partial [Fusobacterium sp.]|uniref:FRG domain-containing protein n=1 Tax=Fusobacterium sp. TaxID=68766 RepID=UPI002628D263